MKTISHFLMISVLAVLASACQKPSGTPGAATPDMSRPVGSDERPSSLDGTPGILELRRLCLSAPGAKFEVDLRCHCEDSNQYFTIARTGEAQCKDIPEDLYKDEVREAISTRNATWLQEQIDEQGGMLSSSATVLLDLGQQISYDDWKALKSLVEFEGRGFWPNTPARSMSNESVGIRPTITLNNQALNPKYIDDLGSVPRYAPVTGNVEEHTILFFESSLKDVVLAYDMREIGKPNEPQPTSSVARDYPAFKALHEGKSFLEEFVPQIGQIQTVGECAKLCTFTLSWTTAEGSYPNLQRYFQAKGQLKWQRTYLHGRVLRDLIWLETSEGKREVTASLTPKGVVANYIVSTQRIDANAIDMSSIVFDRNWNEIGTTTQRKDLRRLAEKVRGLQISGDSSPVFVCDNPIDIETAPEEIVGRLVRGPESSTMIGHGSLLGWISARGNNPTEFFDGLLDVGASRIADSNAHGVSVARTLLNTYEDAVRTHRPGLKPIRFIIANASTCMMKFDQYARQLEEARVKVINISATFTRTPEECRREGRAKNLESDNFLSVMAAGNANERNPTNRCPQNQGPKSNLIVVGGEETDHGSSYVDIWAPDGRSGSSISAPHVAAAAQVISQAFPEFSPKDIRRALLLGARIPSKSYKRWEGGRRVRVYELEPMDVRSGGELDIPKALEIAEEIKNNRSAPVEQILKAKFEEWEANGRLDLYRKNNLIDSL